jgi:hypothetical protein
MQGRTLGSRRSPSEEPDQLPKGNHSHFEPRRLRHFVGTQGIHQRPSSKTKVWVQMRVWFSENVGTAPSRHQDISQPNGTPISPTPGWPCSDSTR